MNILEFRKELLEFIRRNYENINVSEYDMIKNNDTKLYGIVIKRKESNMAPAIYLESFFEKYLDGAGLREIAEEIFSVEKRCEYPGNFDESIFNDFNRIKPLLFAKIINTELNKELLENVPSRKFLDLSIVVYCDLSIILGMNASVLIRNEHIKALKTDIDTLIDIAMDNTKRKGFTRLSLNNIVQKHREETGEYIAVDLDDNNDIDVFTNKERTFGAISLVFVKDISFYREGVYIIPSSIHEVMIVPEKMCSSEEYINNIIREVNSNELDTEEILSNHAYYFSSIQGYRIV